MVAWVVIYRSNPRRIPPPLGRRSHSHFGSQVPPSPEIIAPFFSCTCHLQILQPLCFDIHTKCPGGYPLQEENHEDNYARTHHHPSSKSFHGGNQQRFQP